MFGLRVPHAFIEGGSPEVMPLCYTYKSSSPAVQVNSNIRNLFPDREAVSVCEHREHWPVTDSFLFTALWMCEEGLNGH